MLHVFLLHRGSRLSCLFHEGWVTRVGDGRWKRKILCFRSTATPLVIDDKVFIYGDHGRQERHTELRCKYISTGKLKWSKGRLGTGNLVRVVNKHLYLWELRELLVFQALTTAF